MAIYLSNSGVRSSRVRPMAGAKDVDDDEDEVANEENTVLGNIRWYGVSC